MSDVVLNLEYIKDKVAPLAAKYGVESIYVFGSYARGEATVDSDVDFLVFGGDDFIPSSVFSLSEDVRNALDKEVDMFEIRELEKDSPFYHVVMREKVLVA